MNRDILVAAGIDYDAGVRRFAGRAQLYEKSLAKFPGEGTFARVRADREAGSMEQLLLDAHELKGMCGNVALAGLYDEASALVALLRRDDRTREELDAACARLETVYNDTVAAVLAAAEG